MFSRPRTGLRLGIATALLAIPLTALPSPATAADSQLASGSDWNVTRAPGGYLVTVELSKALPIKSDVPTIEVDGTPIGIATEAADGKSISVFTTDKSVVEADGVEPGWFSKPSDSPAAAKVGAAQMKSLEAESKVEPLDENPSSIGDVEFTESVYNFGTQSIPLAGMPLAGAAGLRGEMQGKIYLPKTGGARPTVLLLHGRHTSCSTGTTPATRWPCNPGQINIPSFAGYDGTARALASHGYAVVSIAANAINSNDNQLALDQGAQARGQLLLDTLTMLDKADKGESISYYDQQTDKDVSLTDALANQDPLPGLTEATQAISPSDLVGRFDLTDVGMMGHSRGGEGVTSAATLNQALAKPWGIKSILPLAPVDFARMTVPNVAMNVILPYCDGDVSNQQGQHMLDDSRYAFDDDSLRSGVWAMGANHNFFNTVWTPGVYAYSVSDDWGATSTDAVCGPRAATNIRMTAQEQYDTGTAYMAGWFRMTLGGEDQFLPMFDGSGAVPAVLNGEDVRSVSTAPATERKTISTLEATSSLVRSGGAATATVCASVNGRTLPQTLPYCTTTMGTSAVPHWTPASNGGNVPATPVTKMAWTALTTGTTTLTPSDVRVTIPKASRNASTTDRLSVKVAADETVATGTDLTISVIDANGKTYSSLVSSLNPLALLRFPASTSTLLKKIIFQQVNVPVSALADAGLDTSDIREVRFAAAVGADGTTTGAAFLSDLAFESSSVGTPVVKTEPTIDVAAPTVGEGNGPGTADIAVYLDGPASKKVTGYVSVLGSATGRGGVTMEKVSFAPGEVCKVVAAPILGDTASSTTNVTAVKTSVINTSGAVMGKSALGNLSVREDDGMTNTTPLLPSAGVQGDACDELAAKGTTGVVTVDEDVVAPGDVVTFGAKGYRAGEGVEFFLGTTSLGVAVADGTGAVTAPLTIPADAATGVTAVKAVGSGTGYTSVGEVEVLAATTTTLSISPEAPAIKQAVTLTAAVEGAAEGSVEFLDGETSLGSADVTEGVATLEVPAGFAAGTHDLTAVLGRTATTQASTSNVVSFTLTKGASTIMLSLDAESVEYGTAVTGSVVVGGTDEGTVTLGYGSTTVDLTLDEDGAADFALPVGLAAGDYDVSAVFTGTDTAEPSDEATASITVDPKTTTSSLSVSSKASKGKLFALVVSVKGATAGTYPTGTVKSYVKNGAGEYRILKTLNLTAASKGSIRLTTSVPKAGAVYYRFDYLGSGNYAGSSSATKAVRVQ